MTDATVPGFLAFLCALYIGGYLAMRVEDWIIARKRRRRFYRVMRWERENPIGASQTRPWSTKRWH